MQTLQGSFTAGELAPSLSARVDFGKYAHGCKKLSNFVVQPHGGAVKRSGFKLLDVLPGEGRLIPFIFNNEQTYCLVFGEKWLRIATPTGFILDKDNSILELPTPYSLWKARQISFVQSGDVLFLACPDVAPYKLKRLSHYTWEFEVMSFACPVASPDGVVGVFKNEAKMSNGAVSKANLITPYTYTVTAVDKDGKESAAAEKVELIGPASNNWQAGDYVHLTWASVDEADEYRVYKGSFGGTTGYIFTTGETEYKDYNISPVTTETPPRWEDPFPEKDYPSLVGFFEQRLIFASTPKRPQTLFLSRSGAYDNFSSSVPVRADDAIELTIASSEVSRMNWLISLRSLILGGEGVEWELSSSEGPFSALSARVTPQSYRGSAPLRALVIGNSILHVTRSGQEIRDLKYDFGSDSYGGTDRTILARHLFEENRIVDWTYQASPDSIVWVVRDDGVLLGMTFQSEHEVYAWHRHETQGKFKAVTSIPTGQEDMLFAIVERGENCWTLELMSKTPKERLENAMYMDCAMQYQGDPVKTIGGLDIFEGKEVALLADGAVLPMQKVVEGRIELNAYYETVTVGLPYGADLETMPIEIVDGQGGASVGRKKTIYAVNLLFQNTVTAKVGTDFLRMESLSSRRGEGLGEKSQFFKGSQRVVVHGGSSSAGTVCIRSDDPLPMAVLAISPEFTVR